MSESINAALHSDLPEDLISGVKGAVIEELSSLDPGVEIENTGYFNHTFIPDLVLNWRDGAKKENRDVFLRFSLRAAAVGRDVEALAGGSPVVLALREESDRQDRRAMEEGIERTTDLLVTDVPALESISQFSPSLGSDRVNFGQQSFGQASPLLTLVRSNFMKGARGLLTSDTTQSLRQSMESETPEEEILGLRSFSETVQYIFNEPAAARLERAAQLMEIGLTGNLSLINEVETDEEALESLVRGRLSQGELKVLLPYLLSHPGITGNPRFWIHVGSMISLEALEEIALDIQGIDLTRLVAPNADKWLATRSALSYNITGAEMSSALNPRWEFRSRLLNLILGEFRVMVSVDRRRIKGRDDSPPARWDELSRNLAEFRLAAVTLDGLNRRVKVTGERDADVYRDVRTITESIQDEFHVPEVEVAVSELEGVPRVVADFRSMMATANNPTSLASLVSVATKILGYQHF